MAAATWPIWYLAPLDDGEPAVACPKAALSQAEQWRSLRRLLFVPVPTDPDDWRRQGQEQDLPPGTVFLQRPYRALDERWEHDHCEMCWAKFMDPQFSAGHAQFIRENPDVLTAGLVTEQQERRLERWVCEPCFEDFATEFGWVASAG